MKKLLFCLTTVVALFAQVDVRTNFVHTPIYTGEVPTSFVAKAYFWNAGKDQRAVASQVLLQSPFLFNVPIEGTNIYHLEMIGFNANGSATVTNTVYVYMGVLPEGCSNHSGFCRSQSLAYELMTNQTWIQPRWTSTSVPCRMYPAARP